MSDREFENYLTLLCGLLRLDGKQRGEIAQELRSHLEDRLQELIERGVSRDEGVRQALSEFGDAAGLAGQFVAISINRKRRWLMRATTFSVAATILIAAGLAIFWPGRNAAPGIATVVAQAPVAAAKTAATGKSDADDEPSLQEKLNKRIDFKVVEMPLRDVFQYLRENTQIQFVLSLKKLDEASVSQDTPITKQFSRVRVATILELMLKDLELTYIEKDGLVLITTPEDAESQLSIRVYDCRDLLTMSSPSSGAGNRSIVPTTPPPPTAAPGTTPVPPNPGAAADPFGAPGAASDPFAPAPRASARLGGPKPPTPDAEVERRARELTTLVTTIVDPDSWTVGGGPGSVYAYSGLVVVSQTEQTHKRVERLFDMLRDASGLEVPKEGKVVR